MRFTTLSSRASSSRQRAPAIFRVAASSALRICCSRSSRAKNLRRSQCFDIGAGLRILSTGPGQNPMPSRCIAGAQCRQTPAESPPRPAWPPASAPDAQTVRSASASTYSSASRCRRFLWAEAPPGFRAAARPFFVTLADRYSPFGVSLSRAARQSTPDFLGECLRLRASAVHP